MGSSRLDDFYINETDRAPVARPGSLPDQPTPTLKRGEPDFAWSCRSVTFGSLVAVGSCCAQFETLAVGAGLRGISVFVGSLAGQDAFLLQSRAVDFGEQLPDFDKSVVAVADVAITHCPGCGPHLMTEYRNELGRYRRQELVQSP